MSLFLCSIQLGIVVLPSILYKSPQIRVGKVQNKRNTKMYVALLFSYFFSLHICFLCMFINIQRKMSFLYSNGSFMSVFSMWV